MTNEFVTDTGKIIGIGRELGKGGEGAVYEVTSSQLLVAKIYNAQHEPDPLKQSKLRFMASSASKDLLAYAAWPQETLHKFEGGPVVGFLMPKVSGRAPIHNIYSPAHRRQEFPNALWDFLVYAARNTASAFAAIHENGHVIGDVNQANVLVGSDSKVVLIDADSFQINANGTIHLCKVGVAHFTPPELQGISNFDKYPRTANHDNFGLALLVFHVLLGGRHPYSGVPLQDDAGEALERDIQSFRYAYANDGRRRGFSPPPRSIPISTIPEQIQTMFTLAFTEHGATGKRPTAQQWVTALDGLRRQLTKCSSYSSHIYSGHLPKCPWCVLENQGIVYFLAVRIGITSAGINGFNILQIWGSIEAILPPPQINIPNISSIAVTPVPLPESVANNILKVVLKVILTCVALLVFASSPAAWFVIILVAYGAWQLVGTIGEGERNSELNKRRDACNIAQQSYNQILGRVRQGSFPEEFATKKQELAKLCEEYKNLPEREKTEIAKLHASAEARQRHDFLDKIFIDTATIPGIGLTKKAALRSFGIETAADVNWKSVMAVKGFGAVLTSAVVDWQKGLERRFVFNPSQSITETDRLRVRSVIISRKNEIENALSGGISELQKIRQDALNKYEELNAEMQKASKNLAQKQADLYPQ